MSFYRFAVTLLRPFIWLLSRPKVTGIENVPEGDGVIACNHLKWWDPFLIAVALHKHNIHFLAKEELFRNPILRFFMCRLNCIPVDRKKADVAAVRKCMRVVKKGDILGVFPEGTRSRTGELLPFEEGAAFIASACGKTIIAARIQVGRTKGAKEIWFDKPMVLAEISPEKEKHDRMKDITAALRACILELAKAENE